MSFSAIVKDELCRLDVNKNCCILAELGAVIRISGKIIINPDREPDIKVITENAAFARRLFLFFRHVCGFCPEVVMRRSKKLKKHIVYLLIVPGSKGTQKLLDSIGIKRRENNRIRINNCPLGSVCCKKAFLRGALLGGGSVSDPEKTYHLEITCHHKSTAKQVKLLLKGFGLKPGEVYRKGNTVIYLKEGEDIVNFLNITGAHTALMEFENIRILKEMRNNVNRVVNCETANLDKTVNASIRQVENIKLINERIGLENLPENLRQIAMARLEYSDASLKELGEILEPPLGKSGVNHRLRKLDRIAERL